MPSGSLGSGPSRESALESLRAALREKHRSRSERERAGAAALEPLGLADCLLISPDAFTAELARRCERVLRRTSLGLGEDQAVVTISEDPLTTSLRSHRLLWITSGQFELESRSDWGPWSVGLFSFDGSRLRPLQRRLENLKALVASERPDLDAADPAAWAGLFAQCLGRSGTASCSLTTVEELEDLEATGDYVIDRRELARIAPLSRPTLEADDHGWTLRFTTAFGEAGLKQALHEWEVVVSREFQIEVRRDVLTERIFREMPIVMS